jgi:integrase
MRKKTQNWAVVVDRYQNGNPIFGIRRWNDGKLERYPAVKYRQYKNDREQLELLVSRLNYTAERAAKAKHEIRHAFINEKFLAEYEDWLRTQIPREKGVKMEMSYLRRHFLQFFINQLDLKSPQDWYEVHDTKWANYLLSDLAPASSKAKRDVINAGNRFLRRLHFLRKEEVPELEFTPISPAKFAAIEAEREMNGEARESKYILPEDWRVIEKALPNYPHLEPFVQIGYRYGLRRQELVGLLPEDVRKGHLRVNRQMEKQGEFTYLKGKKQRNVNHWYATPAQAAGWLLRIQRDALTVHPRTLSAYFDELIEDLSDRLTTTYTLHDLRHTFITRALREHNSRDVQLAAGHKHIGTTMGYAHDDRDSSDEAYLPESA